jgi:tRNA pseudouridine55 synthase
MDGVIVINKHSGATSHDVCAAVKKAFGFKKVGHAGTLDPLATGVLPVCVNEATKLVQFLMHREKEYVCTLQLGAVTDTQDSTGKVLASTRDIPRSPELITRTIHGFRGEQLQTPPMFSALKHNGTPLYKLARKGQTVQRAQRPVSIHAIEVLSLQLPHVAFRVACSHGTYVRTLCHDIGQQLGCGAHMTGLERTRNGAFTISRSVTLAALLALSRDQALEQHLLSPNQALCGLPEVTVSDAMERKIRTGAAITLGDLGMLRMPPGDTGQQVKVLSFKGSLIGIVEPLPCAGLPVPGDTGARAWRTLRVLAR